MNPAIHCLEDIDQMSTVLDKLIDKMNEVKVQYLTGTLPEDEEKLIREMLTGTLLDSAVLTNKSSAQVIITHLIIDYVKSIAEFPNTRQSRLAFHISNQEILTWVIIPDDREDVEFDFYRIEAKINREYRNRGFSMSTTVVEKSDNLNIPSHYKEYTMHG